MIKTNQPKPTFNLFPSIFLLKISPKNIPTIANPVIVNNNLIFYPSIPTVYDGNILKLSVSYSLNTENTENKYVWKSLLEPSFIKYENEITLHPYNTQDYNVSVYNNNDNLLSEGNIKVIVIQKPANIIDIDILPYKWYKLILNKNKLKLTQEIIKDKVLSFKIINFYYTTLQNAYRMEWTNKNGVSTNISWITYYQILNDSNRMVLSFEQQWKFFQYIQMNTSNFRYMLNIINQVYLEIVKKIPLYPIEPANF